MNKFTITRDESSALKALAIICVVIDHFGQAFGIGIVNPLGPIGVFLFLFLSGYGLSCSFEKSGRKKYFSKKLLKVYLPYFLTVMLFLIWSLCIGREGIGFVRVCEYLTLITLPQGSYWYLILLFYWYIVFFLLTFVYKKGKILLLLSGAAALLILLLKGNDHVYVWNFLSFPLGVTAARFSERIGSISARCNVKILAAVLFILAAAFAVIKKLPVVEKSGLEAVDNLLQIGLTLSSGFLLILLRKWMIKLSAVKAALLLTGSVSYELYLSHAVPLEYLYDKHSLAALAVYLLSVGVSLLVLISFDKIVISRLENRLKKDKKAAS